jgi:protein tyrosine phosphatase
MLRCVTFEIIHPVYCPVKKNLRLDATLLQAGETVYVHCSGGHGRTGLAVGTWHSPKHL